MARSCAACPDKSSIVRFEPPGRFGDPPAKRLALSARCRPGSGPISWLGRKPRPSSPSLSEGPGVEGGGRGRGRTPGARTAYRTVP